MRRVFLLIGLIVTALLALPLAKMLNLGPKPPRPDLELSPAVQMANPDSVNLDMAFAPKNPFLAEGVNPLPHGDSAQQDATPLAGPMGNSRELSESELSYQFLGPGYFGI